MTKVTDSPEYSTETVAKIFINEGISSSSVKDELQVEPLREFERMVQQTFSVSGREREMDLLTKRMGLSESKIYTLQEIGDFYGISRERVRQIEKQALGRLIKLIEGSDKSIAPSPIITNALRRFKSSLREMNVLLLEEDIFQVYKSFFGDSGENHKEDSIKLLMAAYEFKFIERKELISRGFSNNCWLSDNGLIAENIVTHQKTIIGILQQCVIPITFFDLVISIKKKHKNVLKADIMRDMLRTIEAVIEVNNDRVQVKMEYLRSLADRAYRVLWERNERMLSTEIVREINRQMILNSSTNRTNTNSLVSQLAGDRRFKSIGKRGWSLSEWKGHDPRTIVELIRESIFLKNSPATVQEIISHVRNIQPDVKETTIRSYLSQKDRFTRTSITEYALAEWKYKPYKSNQKIREPRRATIRDEVRHEVIKYLSASSNKAVPLRELMCYLEKTTKARDHTLYAYISDMHEVVKEKSDGNRFLVRLLSKGDANKSTELRKLVTGGESNTVEYKSTLRHNMESKQKDTEIEHAWLKTIAAFLNTNGGHLLVGIDDNGCLLDLKLDDFDSHDKLMQYVGSKLEYHIGPRFIPFIKYEIEEIDGKHLLVFTIEKSATPVFLNKGKNEKLFYVRNGNASKVLKDTELVEYVLNNFG
jgi:DNA-directed RNA polymerase delta subunit